MQRHLSLSASFVIKPRTVRVTLGSIYRKSIEPRNFTVMHAQENSTALKLYSVTSEMFMKAPHPKNLRLFGLIVKSVVSNQNGKKVQ